MQLNYKLFLLLLFAFINIYAQKIPEPQIIFSPRHYICFYTAESVNVDGVLNEDSWKKAKWTEEFVDIEGDIKPNPRLKTKVKMLWDDNYFYIAAELEEPHIWATLKNRDDIIFYDNDFEIFIDPDGDTHRYVEFETNAFNTVWDLFLIKPYRDTKKAALHNYDIKGLKSGVKIYGTINNTKDIDSCWTVEVAFPWEAFKEISDVILPPNEQDIWRINFSRVEWKTEIKNNQYQKVINPLTNKPYPEDNWVWSPQGVINMHYPEMWGYVQFTKTKVGDGEIDFNKNIIEDVKWYLRQVYYKQKSYFEKNNKYAKSIKQLGIKPARIKGFISKPVMDVSSDRFKCSLLSRDKNIIITIYEDGLIHCTKKLETDDE